MNICNLFSGFGKFILNSYDINNKYLLVDENEFVILISPVFLLNFNNFQFVLIENTNFQNINRFNLEIGNSNKIMLSSNLFSSNNNIFIRI